MPYHDYPHGWAKERIEEAIRSRALDVLGEQARDGRPRREVFSRFAMRLAGRLATFVMAFRG